MNIIVRALVCIAILSVSGCATHAPTRFAIGTSAPSVALAPGTVDIVASVNYLKKVDSVAGSQASKYAGDQRIIAGVISDELKHLPAGAGMRLTDEASSSKARFRCNITLHQFVAWKELLLILLPLPTSNNESFCVTATLFDHKMNSELKKYEEWGYSKQTRFFMIEGSDNPPLNELRTFLVKKVLSDVATDVSAAMTQSTN